MKKKKGKTFRFQKFLFVFALFLIMVSPLMIVFENLTLSEVNYEVEKIKKEISKQQKENESLEMKINELASLENIQRVIQKEGLVYNNDNIKNIE